MSGMDIVEAPGRGVGFWRGGGRGTGRVSAGNFWGGGEAKLFFFLGRSHRVSSFSLTHVQKENTSIPKTSHRLILPTTSVTYFVLSVYMSMLQINLFWNSFEANLGDLGFSEPLLLVIL